MSDVSDMLFEFYKANVANAPKNQTPQTSHNKFGQTSPTSAETHEPSTIAAIATNGAAAGVLVAAGGTGGTGGRVRGPVTASKNLQGDELMAQQPIAAQNISTINNVGGSNASLHPRIKLSNGTKTLAAVGVSDGNVGGGDGGVGVRVAVKGEGDMGAMGDAPPTGPIITAIPTSVLVPISPQIDIKPVIHPTTGLVISPSTNVVQSTSTVQSSTSCASVIKMVPSNATNAPIGGGVVPPAAAIAAALLRDGYHSFQQQLRAQEILKHTQQQRPATQPHSVEMGNDPTATATATSTKILENFLRQQQHQQRNHRHSECDNDTTSEANDGDDEDDSRYNGFDDIHLVESGSVAASTSKDPNYAGNSLSNIFHSASQDAPTTSSSLATSSAMAGSAADAYLSDESQKFMFAQAQVQVLRNLEYSLGDFNAAAGNTSASNQSNASNASTIGLGPDGEPIYECRHCGKKYRWKSTLRRHENVECGGKEPSHQCPYCPYKSKQRGNLGVHVRKHHSNLPQLASKRRSKYSTKEESTPSSANASDDSSSKLIIDCSK